MAGYALGFVMGATSAPRFAFYRKWLRRLRVGSNGNCVPMPPSTPAPNYRRIYYDMPSAVAECGGPCEAGPAYCDCGLLWQDVPRLDPGSVQRGNGRGGPTTPKPDIIPGDTP